MGIAPTKYVRALMREDYNRTRAGVTVDRDKRVIRGLKICGLESSNGRSYPIELLKANAGLYEGAACYLNHPAKAGDQRDVRDHVGRFVNVEARADGLYGDLEYLAESIYAAKLLETAERMPEQIGCSHNAEGDYEIINGRMTVTKLHEIRSVDIVADPATTNGLFEAKTMTHTFKSILESARKKFAGGKLLAVKRLIEDDSMVDPLAAEVPAADPETALSDGFKAGMYACVDSFCAGDLDLVGFVGKVKELAKAHDKLVDGGEAEVPAAEAEGDKPADEKKDEDKPMESRLIKLERRDATRDLCESIGFIPTKDQLNDLCEIENEPARKRFAESLKAAAGQKPVTETKPGVRSKIVTEGKPAEPLTAKQFVEQITRV